MKKHLLLLIVLPLFSLLGQAQCFNIETILVHACAPSPTPPAVSNEGFNEMVRFKIGPTALNTSNLTVSWPNNPWQGLVQNSTTASKVATLNAGIIAAGSCGQLIEPISGVLPANARVILVTSYNFDVTSNSFNSLNETYYIIFQDNPSTTTGHFVNYNPISGVRTLSVNFIGSCSQSVSYNRSLLIDNSAVTGIVGDYKGASVSFAPNGVATYINNGCTAPVSPFTVNAGANPNVVCPGDVVTLNGSAQGYVSTLWSSTLGGSFTSATSFSSTYTVPTSATSGPFTIKLTATNTCGGTISADIPITISSVNTPTFTQVNPISSGGTLSALPTTSNNGIQGTWSPALNNTSTTTYTFTPNAGQCATTQTMTITVNPVSTCPGTPWSSTIGYLAPTPATNLSGDQFIDTTNGYLFVPPSLATVGYYWTNFKYNGSNMCVPDHFSFEVRLKTSATTGIPSYDTIINVHGSNGDNWATLMGEAAGQSYTAIGVNGTTVLADDPSLVFPSLNNWTVIKMEYVNHQIKYYLDNNLFFTGNYTGDICNLNGFDISFKGSGYVDYVKINDATGTPIYSEEFTNCNNLSVFPNVCNPPITVATSVIAPNCTNGTLQLFATPSVASSNLSYLWTGPNGFSSNSQNPVILIPTTAHIGSYTCQILVNACTPISSSSVQINASDIPSQITPTFNPISAICSGDTATLLPSQSTNGIAGTWSPTFNNNQTTEYTFTPNSGQCATSQTLTVVVNQTITPQFDPVSSICSGSSIAPLPTTSLNGILGSWQPALNNTQTTTYQFTPNSGQCILPQSLTVIVLPLASIPTFDGLGPYCIGQAIPDLPTTSNNGISGTWSPAISNQITTTYTFTPNNTCSVSTQLPLTINPLPTATFSLDQTTACKNGTSPILTFTGAGGTAPYTFTYTFDGGPFQTVTTSNSSNTASVSVPTNTNGSFDYNLFNVQSGNNPACSQPILSTTTVTIFPLPAAVITTNTEEVCQNDTTNSIVFMANRGIPPYTFSYTANGVSQTVSSLAGQNSVSVSVPTNVSGTQTYVLTGVSSSTSPVCSQTQSSTTTITIEPLPTATIAINTS
ncbi:MAG: hypothetical protein CFE24_13710, partial [Flavobacterium sp. BFFFF2]